MTRGASRLPLLGRRGARTGSACAPCHADVAAAASRKPAWAALLSHARPSTLPRQALLSRAASDSYFLMIERDGRYYPAPLAGRPRRQGNQRRGEADRLRHGLRQSRAHLPPPHAARHAAAIAARLVRRTRRPVGHESRLRPPRLSRLHPRHLLRVHVLPQRVSEDPGGESRGRAPRPSYLAPLPDGIDCQRCHGAGRNTSRPSGQGRRS